MTTIPSKKINPETISGHKLVKYLIENPDAAGNFKWHTLLSCMWKDLLIPCPQFAQFADFNKITHYDAVKIVKVHVRMAPKFPQHLFSIYDWIDFIGVAPELAEYYDLSQLYPHHWQLLVCKQKAFADLCPWQKFNGTNWCDLLLRNSSFADKCNWSLLGVGSWHQLLRKKKSLLPYFKLKYLPDAKHLSGIMAGCYLGENRNLKGLFADPPQDAATYLVYKSMDRENGKIFLKKKYATGDWKFIMELFQLSPQEIFEVAGKKDIPFFITLMAPDDIFYKLIDAIDISQRDIGGNTLLFPAVIHDVNCGNSERTKYLEKQGLNLDEKNLAGFSCADLHKRLKNKNR